MKLLNDRAGTCVPVASAAPGEIAQLHSTLLSITRCVCVQMIKYGVIGLQAFQQDLHHWSHLYVGGRMHKPVAALTAHTAAEAAQQHNLRAALTTALLLSPKDSTLKVR